MESSSKITIDLKQQIELSKSDIKHFGPIYDMFHKQVFRFIYNRVEAKEDAADLTSSTFMKAMTGLKNYQDRDKMFISWLLKIAYNEVGLFYRSKKVRDKFFVEEKNLAVVTSDLEFDDDNAFTLKDALEYLAKDDYDLVQMKYFEGLSFEQIAKIVGKSEDSLKVKAFRIRAKLKNIIIDLSKKHGVEILLATAIAICTLLIF